MNLRKARENAKMTLKEVGEATGVHFTTIQNFETGKRNISPLLLQRLAELYGVKVEDIKIENVTRW